MPVGANDRLPRLREFVVHAAAGPCKRHKRSSVFNWIHRWQPLQLLAWIYTPPFPFNMSTFRLLPLSPSIASRGLVWARFQRSGHAVLLRADEIARRNILVSITRR